MTDEITTAAGANTETGAEEVATAGQSQPGSDPTQDQTAGGGKDTPPSLERNPKGGKKSSDKGNPEPPKVEPPKKKVKVRVICEGYLGTALLQKGDVTSLPDYVALLDDDRDLVELVK